MDLKDRGHKSRIIAQMVIREYPYQILNYHQRTSKPESSPTKVKVTPKRKDRLKRAKAKNQ